MTLNVFASLLWLHNLSLNPYLYSLKLQIGHPRYHVPWSIQASASWQRELTYAINVLVLGLNIVDRADLPKHLGALGAVLTYLVQVGLVLVL